MLGEEPLFSHRLLLLVTSTGFRSYETQREREREREQQREGRREREEKREGGRERRKDRENGG